MSKQIVIAILLSMVLPAQAEEAPRKLYKCTDAAGVILYTNKAKVDGRKCSLLVRTPEVGDKTTLGLVIEVKPPIAKIQTNKGDQWHRIDELKMMTEPNDNH